jgi:hypothetical protein
MSAKGRRERPEKPKNAPRGRIPGAGTGPPVHRVVANFSCRQFGNFPAPIDSAPATAAITLDGNIGIHTFTAAMLCPSVDAALASREEVLLPFIDCRDERREQRYTRTRNPPLCADTVRAWMASATSSKWSLVYATTRICQSVLPP